MNKKQQEGEGYFKHSVKINGWANALSPKGMKKLAKELDIDEGHIRDCIVEHLFQEYTA